MTTYANNSVRFGEYNHPIINNPMNLPVKYAKSIDKEVRLPKMENTIYRSTLLQQLPCVTINDITYPNARVSLVDPMAGYRPCIVDANTKINKSNVLGYFPKEFTYNAKILKPASTFPFM